MPSRQGSQKARVFRFKERELNNPKRKYAPAQGRGGNTSGRYNAKNLKRKEERPRSQRSRGGAERPRNKRRQSSIRLDAFPPLCGTRGRTAREMPAPARIPRGGAAPASPLRRISVEKRRNRQITPKISGCGPGGPRPAGTPPRRGAQRKTSDPYMADKPGDRAPRPALEYRTKGRAEAVFPRNNSRRGEPQKRPNAAQTTPLKGIHNYKRSKKPGRSRKKELQLDPSETDRNASAVGCSLE